MKILTVDFNSPNAPEQLSESLNKTGFAIISNHTLPWKDIEKAYSEWKCFFATDAKFKYKFNPEKQDGYISTDHSHQAANSEIKVKDVKEVFQLYFPWGQYPQELSDLPRNLFMQKFELAKLLLNWIEECLPPDIKSTLKNHLSDIVSLERTLYRAIHYPPFNGNEEAGAVRAAAHKDFDLITLLPCATEAGLQVKDTNGNWHEVGTSPESIVINAGGTLEEATNGYYKATIHRVVNPIGDAFSRSRFSTPIFLHAKKDAYLSENFPTVGQYFDEQIRLLALDKHSTY